MPNVVEVSTFVLKNGVSEQDFLTVSEKFNSEFMSKQKGFISSTLLKKDGKYLELHPMKLLSRCKRNTSEPKELKRFCKA